MVTVIYEASTILFVQQLFKTAEAQDIQEEKKAKKKPDCQEKVKKTVKKEKSSLHNYNFNIKLPRQPVTFGKTVVLLVVNGGGNTYVLLVRIRFNPFTSLKPHTVAFLCLCSRQLLKTLWQMISIQLYNFIFIRQILHILRIYISSCSTAKLLYEERDKNLSDSKCILIKLWINKHAIWDQFGRLNVNFHILMVSCKVCMFIFPIIM